MSIRITIEKTVAYTENQNLVTEEQSTGQKDEFRREIFDRKYQIVSVNKEKTFTILSQTVEDESSFDLGAVIVAINNFRWSNFTIEEKR